MENMNIFINEHGSINVNQLI